MADLAVSSLPQSGEILYNQEEFSSDNCFKCMYFEERLIVTLCELSSLELAIKLLYNQINETHTESEVILNSIGMKDDHVGLELPSNWYTIKSKSNRTRNKLGREEFSQSVGPVTVINNFTALSNLPDFTLGSDEGALQDKKKSGYELL
jgi:hypothetical protein